MLFVFPLILLAAQTLDAQERRQGPPINNYSGDKEAKLGQVLAGDIRRKTTAIESNDIRDYIEILGARLGGRFIREGVAFSFTVVTDSLGGPTHEPLALPAGYIFIPADLILAAQDEAELAGMIGHAMAHVADRHTTIISRSGEGAVPLVWVGAGDGLLIPHGYLKTQREFELRADQLTIGMMRSADFDPSSLVRYIKRLQSADPDKSDELSSLPAVATRIAGLERAIAQLPAQSYSTSDELAAVQAKVRSLTAGQPASTRRAPSLKR